MSCGWNYLSTFLLVDVWHNACAWLVIFVSRLCGLTGWFSCLLVTIKRNKWCFYIFHVLSFCFTFWFTMNWELTMTLMQAFFTDQERALEDLFGDIENSRKFDNCLNTMATRIATVFASLKVCHPRNCVLSFLIFFFQ